PAAEALVDRNDVLGQPKRALARRLVHIPGSTRRLRDRLGTGDARRARAGTLAPAQRRAAPVRDRGERDSDHRLCADRESVVRGRVDEELEDLHRGGPLLLPRARQHAAWIDLGPPSGPRADAFVRRRAGRALPASSYSDCAAVHLL